MNIEKLYSTARDSKWYGETIKYMLENPLYKVLLIIRIIKLRIRNWLLSNYNAFKSEYEKFLKKNPIFFKNVKGGTAGVVLFTFTIIFSLGGLVYCLLIKKLVPIEFFYMSMVALLGWFFALITSLIYTKQNREINSSIQNNEIRKRLEIEAFKEVNKMIEEVTLSLSEIEFYYGDELIKELSYLSYKNTFNNILFLDKLKAPRGVEGGLLSLWLKFKLKLLAHEIVLIRFKDLKDKLDLKFKKSILLVSEFGKYTQKIKTKNALKSNVRLEIKNRCIKIDKSLLNLTKGLREYGIELQNKMLGEIFNSKIPKMKNKERRRAFAQIINSLNKQDK